MEILNLIILSATFLVLYYIFSILIKPAYQIFLYKQKLGNKIVVEYLPHILSMNPMVSDFKKNDDCYYSYKKMLKEKPDTQALIQSVSGRPQIMILDPDLAKIVLSNNQWYERIYNTTFAQEFLFKNGILTVSGEMWKKQRHLMSQSFTFFHTKKRFGLVNGICKKVMDQQVQELDVSKPVALRNFCYLVTAEVSVKTFLLKGLPNSFPIEISDVISESYDVASENLCYKIKTFLKGSTWATYHFYSEQERKLVERMNNIQEVAKTEIVQRMKASKDIDWDNYIDQDVLDVYLRENNRLENAGQPLIPLEEIQDQFLMLLSVGLEPPAASYAMMFYNLAAHPQEQQKILDELERIVPNFDDLDFDKLAQLEYLQCFVLESLRMHPSDAALIQKYSIVDHKVGDFDIKKGYIVNCHILGSQTNEKYYKDAHTFRPERWLGNTKNIDPYKFLIFSAGSRNCMGQNLSYMEGKLLILNVLKRFEVKLNRDIPLRMREEFSYNPYDDRLVYLKPKFQKATTS